MATKKFPSEMSSRGTVLGTDKILIYNATTGASDEVCTVAELFTYLLANAATFASTINTSNGDITIKRLVNTDKGGGRLRFLGEYDRYLGGLNTVYTGSSYIYEAGLSFRVQNSGYDASVGFEALLLKHDLSATFASTIGATGITLTADNANKPGAGGLWTVTSDERIKKDIELADLDICYNTIKNIPLKRYAWADGVYSEGQVPDRHNLGWIAQDVQKYFSKAVSVKPFTKAEKIEDGIEEYQEQDFTMQPKDALVIEIVNGNPVQVKKTIEEKVLLFDELPVKDELGKVVLENGKPLLAKVPKMVTKTRPKFRQEVIEDCLDLNSGQLNAALYGAVQACMLKIESLEKEVALLKQ